MHETYRMLGREREAELAREAERLAWGRRLRSNRQSATWSHLVALVSALGSAHPLPGAKPPDPSDGRQTIAPH